LNILVNVSTPYVVNQHKLITFSNLLVLFRGISKWAYLNVRRMLNVSANDARLFPAASHALGMFDLSLRFRRFRRSFIRKSSVQSQREWETRLVDTTGRASLASSSLWRGNWLTRSGSIGHELLVNPV